MRKLVSIGVLILGLCLAAAAADEAVPKLEVFGGISWLHIDSMGLAGIKTNYAGWDAEAQYNINKFLGVTADIGGNYGRLVPDTPTSHSYTFVFGPTFSYRAHNSTLFAHTLFGANSTNIISAGGSASDSAFAMAWGGGIDVKVNQTFAIRLGQLDWLYTRHNLTSIGLKDHQGNLRYAGGIVINFGH